MRQIILFSIFLIASVVAISQPSNRVKLRQLEAAPGSDYYIRSVNDTCAWVMNSEFADSLSVLQDSIIVLYAGGSEISRDTVGPFGGGTVYYQLLRNDGSDQTERNATNFISTSTVVATLLDDSGSDETEVRMSVPTGGITTTEILDGTITTSDLAFTPSTGSGTANQVTYWSGTNTIAGDADLTFDGTNLTSGGVISGQVGEIQTNGSYCANPSGGVVALGTGAIEVTLPSPQFGGGGSFRQWRLNFKLTVMQASTATENRAFHVTIYGGNTPIVSGGTYVYSLGNDLETTLTWSVGDDGTNIVFWLGSTSTAWGNGKAIVSDVYYAHVSGTQPTLTELCSGWTMAMESSALGTVTRSGVVFPQASYLTTSADHDPAAEYWKGISMIAFRYNGTFTGAHEITYSGTLPSSGRFRINGSISLASVSNPYNFTIMANINSAAWTGATVIWENGPPQDARTIIRVGDATTTLKIWIGELTSSWAGSSVAIKSIEAYAISTNYSATFSAMTNPSSWSIGTEATAFNNVDATLSPPSVGSIPYSSTLGYGTSSTFFFTGTNLSVGAASASAKVHIVGTGATSSTSGLFVENNSGTDLLLLQDDGALGILENLPARTLDVGGEVRIQDLVTDSPTKIVGSDSDGDLGNMYIGAGLTLSGDTLYADGSATTLYYQTIQDDGSDETQRDKLNFGDTGPFHFDVTDDAGNNRTDVLCYPDNNGITYGYIQQVSANKLLGNPTGSTANVSEIAVGDGLQFNGSSIQKINSEFHSYTSATTTTFNIPSGAQEVELICVGGGGGGGSGRKGATTEANTGGGGGGGGSYTRVIYSVSELASTTLDLTIGAGGSGGAGRATNNTNGGAGSAGGDTFIDCDGYTIALAGGGLGGSAGTTAASTGGAGGSVGDFDGLAGTGCATSGSVSSGSAQVKKSAQGGGAGGGIPTGGTPARTGGATGKWNYSTEAALTGGSAGNDGQSCGISYILDAQHQIGGPGGSGGGSSITGNAGSGGFPCYGGGGGGGGAALNSIGNSGAGGNGGAGFIIIIVRY